MFDTRPRAEASLPVGSRRRTIRVAASHLKAFATAQMIPIVVDDLSAGGFSATCPRPFETNSVHVIRLTLGRIAVNTRARVLNCRPADPGNAARHLARFEFVGQPRPDGSTIDDLLGAITASAVSLRAL